MKTEIAKITGTMLGYEGHGILTAMLQVDYGGSGQGIGGYCLDEPVRDDADQFVGRFGTAFGMEWVRRAMSACGVDSWEQVKGRTILVYKEDDGYNAKVIGFGPLPTEPGKPFLFDDLREWAGMAS